MAVSFLDVEANDAKTQRAKGRERNMSKKRAQANLEDCVHSRLHPACDEFDTNRVRSKRERSSRPHSPLRASARKCLAAGVADSPRSRDAEDRSEAVLPATAKRRQAQAGQAAALKLGMQLEKKRAAELRKTRNQEAHQRLLEEKAFKALEQANKEEEQAEAHKIASLAARAAAADAKDQSDAAEEVSASVEEESAQPTGPACANGADDGEDLEAIDDSWHLLASTCTRDMDGCDDWSIVGP
eukprot:TRINITY_DN78018_c0_g1_i1.p1 TRINITY_DN78018_c0_g1~~TRINITY_DN78018_c0_g1_i1.p1  ORF type:complete len:271 (-),score=86.37 TRINITY_DN78018_c0_g1_i1:107-832(-)